MDIALTNRKLPNFGRVDFYPFLAASGKPDLYNTFNTFTGFPLEKVALDIKQPAFEDSGFYRHIKMEMLNGNSGEMEHFMDHIADMIQQPAHIRGPSHLFYTAPGMGKGLLAKFMGRLLGIAHVITFNDTAEYFSKFNSDQSNKILKIFEEVSDKGEAFHKHDRLKADQTKSTDRIEPKGLDSYNIRHCARFWYYTNNENALFIENNDRRHTLHKANNRYANNIKYFAPLWEAVKDEKFCRTAFEYFANRKYEIQNVITAYETKYKKQQKLSNVGGGIRFVIEMVEGDFKNISRGGDLVNTKDMHAAYRAWCEENGTRFHLSTLKTQIRKLDIADAKRASISGRRTLCYRINVDELKLKFRDFLKDPEFEFDIEADESDVDPDFVL